MRRNEPAADPLSKIDTSVPHPARRYDYWLGGKDNFAADRASGDAVAAAFPTIRTAIIENRAFLRRAVNFLTADAGIRQFFDIGTGIPTSPNVHEIAQSIAPASRVVYVDNDPVVLSHARALMISAPEGDAAYIDADLRDPDKILNDPDLRRVLDMSAPVALMLVAVLHFIPDEADPYGIVARLVEALPSGSYLAMSHATYDYMPPEALAKLGAADSGQVKFNPRSRADFARFFDGLDLLPPGIVSIADWRADNEPAPRPTPAEMASHCGVARKP